MRGLDDWLTHEPEDSGLILGQTTPVARKEHSCSGCKKPIPPGTRYLRSFAIFEGSPVVEKLCLACQLADADL